MSQGGAAGDMCGAGHPKESYSDRKNDYKCLMSPLSLSSDHTQVGFSKMSIHESFLVVMLSIFFSYRSVIICLKYLGDPMLFYIFAYVCVCVCVCVYVYFLMY